MTGIELRRRRQDNHSSRPWRARRLKRYRLEKLSGLSRLRRPLFSPVADAPGGRLNPTKKAGPTHSGPDRLVNIKLPRCLSQLRCLTQKGQDVLRVLVGDRQDPGTRLHEDLRTSEVQRFLRRSRRRGSSSRPQSSWRACHSTRSGSCLERRPLERAQTTTKRGDLVDGVFDDLSRGRSGRSPGRSRAAGAQLVQQALP